MRIGYPGKMFDIPNPTSGMGFSNNSDSETLELDTGGRFVADKPTTYKSFNMSWRSTTPKLQPLIDIYNKRYGTDPFYITDMRDGVGNMLPPRWAYGRQLGEMHGAIGTPLVDRDGTLFTSNRYSASQPTILIPLIKGKNHNLAIFVSDDSFPEDADPPMQYRRISTNGIDYEGWYAARYTRTGEAPLNICTASQTQDFDFIELRVRFLALPVVISHVDLSTSDYRSWDTAPFRPAEGVGGLKFTNALDGDLLMLKNQRIGLSVDCTEVQQ